MQQQKKYRERDPLEAYGDDVREQHPLSKVLDAATAFTPPILDQPADQQPDPFAPLIDRAPEMIGQSMRQVFEAAAKHCEAAGEDNLQAALTLRAQCKEVAGVLRALGEEQAQAAGGAAALARELAALLKAQRARSERFRSGVDAAVEAVEALGAARLHDPAISED